MSEDKRIKVALFKNIDINFVTVFQSDHTPEEYVQVSEWGYVTLKELSKKDAVLNELKILDANIERVKEVSIKELDRLNDKRHKLLAIGVDDGTS